MQDELLTLGKENTTLKVNQAELEKVIVTQEALVNFDRIDKSQTFLKFNKCLKNEQEKLNLYILNI